MKPLTFEEATQLRFGETLYSTFYKNADGTPQRWRVNGAVQRWKRDPNRIRVPLKYGMYSFDALTESDFIDGVCATLSKEAN